ncbi:MAG: mandelate racemase/muconate lactonizing enzyme family protein [Candidatus Baldrarchaeia archaeon]
MRIKEVKGYLLKVPYPEKKAFAAAWEPAPHKDFTFTLVEVTTDEGISGYAGMISRGFEVIAFIKSAVSEFLKRVPIDPFYVEILTRPLRIGSYFGPRVGLVDIALWDIIGKSLGKPVYKLLGAARDYVKAYMSTGQIKKARDHINDFEEARSKYGFKAVKLRFHRMKWEDDLKVLKEFREAFPEIEIMVDANQAWTYFPPYWDRKTALAVAKELEKLDVVWLEEPLPITDLEGYADLRRRTSVRIAGGELEYGLHRIREHLERGCFDVIQPDPCLSGGITEMKKVAALAEAFHVWYVPHGWEPGIGLAACLQLIGTMPDYLCPYLEYPLDPPLTPEVRDAILTEPIEPRGGFVKIPDKPGLGIEIDMDVVKKYMIKEVTEEA